MHVLIRDRKGSNPETQRGRPCEDMEEEKGVMYLQAKEWQGLLMATRDRREAFPLRISGRKQSCQNLDFEILDFGTVRE